MFFSVTFIALNDVNVRGGNVIKPFARETIKTVLSWYIAICLIFKNRAYFSVTFIALNDVSVRGGNVI